MLNGNGDTFETNEESAWKEMQKKKIFNSGDREKGRKQHQNLD